MERMNDDFEHDNDVEQEYQSIDKAVYIRKRQAYEAVERGEEQWQVCMS